jgi:hypothetical protein
MILVQRRWGCIRVHSIDRDGTQEGKKWAALEWEVKNSDIRCDLGLLEI